METVPHVFSLKVKVLEEFLRNESNGWRRGLGESAMILLLGLYLPCINKWMYSSSGKDKHKEGNPADKGYLETEAERVMIRPHIAQTSL